MKVAIIGGSGFIGSELCRQLAEEGTDFRIIDLKRSYFYPRAWIFGDVTRPETMRETLSRCDTIVNLAAEHKDNVMPRSKYDLVNVKGAENVCSLATEAGVNRIVFTSSVAVYGFAPPDTDEGGEIHPFNDYGRTKAEAEMVYALWAKEHPDRTVTIIRPTVVFGPRNRGNVYNLLRQVASNRFIMVGTGRNAKSMAYVENVGAFIRHCVDDPGPFTVYNYVDKPDFDMNSLIRATNDILQRDVRFSIKLPFSLAYAGATILDMIGKATGRSFQISAIRVAKFRATTKFSSSRIAATGFVPHVSIMEGLKRTILAEFVTPNAEDRPLGATFDTE